MKRIICLLLSVCMFLCFAACGGENDPTSGTTEPAIPTEGNEPTKGQISETAEPTYASDASPTEEPTASTEASTVPAEDSEDPSLLIFRQAMVETPQLFAAAFFGYVPQDADPFAIMQEATPQLCEDLPFLLEIDRDHVLGVEGYLFCIVPADESTTVAVNRRPWNAENESYEEPEVLYRSEIGSPFLVMCPNEDWIPDTEVVITDSNGTVTIWSPYLEPSYHISALRNENGEELIFDFTSYDELPNPGWDQVIDSSELVGTWELAWTEVEGDRNETEAGAHRIVIQRTESDDLLMSYDSQLFPEDNFQNELLTIDMREMYYGCGNDDWVADLDYIGPYDTTYTVTLTVDDILIKQNHFLLDGIPMVGYEFFCRIEE